MTTAQASSALTGILTARLLGPAAKGQLTAVQTWAQMATFLAMFGITSAVTVRVAESGAAGVRTSVGNALAFSAAMGGTVAVAGWLFLPDVLRSQGPGIATLAHLAVLTAPFFILGDLLSSVHLALRNVTRYALYRLFIPLGGLIAVPLLLSGGILGTRSFLMVLLALSVVGCAIIAPGLNLRKASLDFTTLREDLRLGRRAYVTQLLGLINLRVDLLVVSVVLGSTQLGVYGAANSVMVGLTILPGVAGALILPAVARKGAEGANLRTRLVMTRRQANVQLTVASGLALVLVVAAEPLVHVLLGPAYAPAVPVIQVLAPAYAARAYTAVVVNAAIGLRKSWIGAASEGVALVLTLSLLPLLLPRYGIEGAALTSLAAYSMSALVARGCLAHLIRRAPSDQ